MYMPTIRTFTVGRGDFFYLSLNAIVSLQEFYRPLNLKCQAHIFIYFIPTEGLIKGKSHVKRAHTRLIIFNSKSCQKEIVYFNEPLGQFVSKEFIHTNNTTTTNNNNNHLYYIYRGKKNSKLLIFYEPPLSVIFALGQCPVTPKYLIQFQPIHPGPT